jgi:hypothetical protein
MSASPKVTTVSDEDIAELIILAERAVELWGDTSARKTLAAWRELAEARREIEALRPALSQFVTAAKSWHDTHGDHSVQCDWLCECIAPGEAALQK